MARKPHTTPHIARFALSAAVIGLLATASPTMATELVPGALEGAGSTVGSTVGAAKATVAQAAAPVTSAAPAQASAAPAGSTAASSRPSSQAPAPSAPARDAVATVTQPVGTIAKAVASAAPATHPVQSAAAGVQNVAPATAAQPVRTVTKAVTPAVSSAGAPAAVAHAMQTTASGARKAPATLDFNIVKSAASAPAPPSGGVTPDAGTVSRVAAISSAPVAALSSTSAKASPSRLVQIIAGPLAAVTNTALGTGTVSPSASDGLAPAPFDLRGALTPSPLSMASARGQLDTPNAAQPAGSSALPLATTPPSIFSAGMSTSARHAHSSGGALVPRPAPAPPMPGGSAPPAAVAAMADSPASIFLLLVGLLWFGSPWVMRRLRLASQSLKPAPLILIPERPG